MIEAQNLKVTSKSGRSRVVDSPPLTLQSVVAVWSSNISGNGLGLDEGGKLEARSFNLAQMLNEALQPHFWQTHVSCSFFIRHYRHHCIRLHYFGF